MVDEEMPDFDADFNGDDYQSERDKERLRGQILRVYTAIKDGRWRTLRQLAEITGDPEASVSAQLRHLRKPRFGGHEIVKRNIKNGLYEYRLI